MNPENGQVGENRGEIRGELEREETVRGNYNPETVFVADWAADVLGEDNLDVNPNVFVLDDVTTLKSEEDLVKNPEEGLCYVSEEETTPEEGEIPEEGKREPEKGVSLEERRCDSEEELLDISEEVLEVENSEEEVAFKFLEEKIHENEYDSEEEYGIFGMHNDKILTKDGVIEFEQILTKDGVIEFEGDFIKHDIVSDKFCSHNVRNVWNKCPCFLYEKQGAKFLFNEIMRKDAAIISQEYNIATVVGGVDYILKKYVRHKVVVLALSTQDNKITTTDLTRPEMLKFLYILREMYDNFSDFGQKKLRGVFVAEGESCVQKFWNFVEKFTSPAKTIGDFVKSVFEKFTGMLTGFFDVISSKMSDMLTKAFTKAANIVVSCITEGVHDLEVIWQNSEVRSLIIVFGVLLMIMLVEAIGIMTVTIVKPFLRLICDKFTKKPKMMIGEGDMSIMTLLIMVVVGMMKLTSGSETAIMAKVKSIGSLLQSCTQIGGGLMVAFLLLPQVVQDAIKCSFSPQYAQKIAIETWMSRTHALVILSKQVKVVAHPTYRKWLLEQYVEGAKLKKTLTDKALIPMFMRAFSELIKILSIVNSLDSNEKSRPLPFCIHLAALPGMGKSLTIELFMKAAGSKKHYCRAMADPYFSGLLDHDGLFIDEFLEVDPEQKAEQCKEYLSINSNVTFKPPMPSLDNLSCGIKGTSFAPVVVATAGNATHPGAPSGFQSDAILRRRHLTVEMVPKPGTNFFKNNRVNLESMTDEEIREGAWAEFVIHQNLKAGVTLGQYTLSEILLITNKMAEDHRLLCERVAEALNVGHVESFDPAEMLDDLLRDMNGIPNGSKSIYDVVKDWFMGSLVGEGPTPKGMDSSSEAGSSSTGETKKNRKVRRAEKAFKGSGSTVEANKRRAKHYVQKGELTEEEAERYYSSEESSPVCDVIADLAHENVDHTKIHRHMCTNCGRHFAHRHDVRNHVTLCAACEAKGVKEGLIWTNQMDYPIPRFDPLHLGPDLSLTTMTEEEIRELTLRIRDNFYHMDLTHFGGEYAPVLSDDVRSFFNEMSSPRTAVDDFFDDVASSPKACYVLTGFNIMQKVIMLWMVVKAIRYFSRPDEEETVVYFGESGRPNRETHKAQRNSWRVENYAQAGPRGLTCSVGSLNCYSLPVEGRSFIMHSHVFYDRAGNSLPLTTDLTVSYSGKRFATTLAECRIRSMTEKDLIMITLPPNCSLDQFPKSIKKFIKQEDLSSFSFGTSSLELNGITNYIRIQRDRDREYNYGGKLWKLDDCFGYVAQTVPGDCGKPIIAQGSWAPGKIVGIHVAGGAIEGTDKKAGMGTFITQEVLDFMLKEEPTDISAVTFSAEGLQGPNLIKVEKVPESERVHLPRANRIKPSVITADLDFPTVKTPSLMCPSDPRSEGIDPIMTSINNLIAVEQPKVSESTFQYVVEQQRHYWEKTLHRGKLWVPLSIEEAIGGVPGRLASLKISSSSGYPLCKINGKPGKKSLFWYEGQNLVIDESFRIRVQECYNEIMVGNDYPSRFIAFLKDELTSSTKIKAKTCRVIFSGDVTLTVVGRMMYGNFLIAFHESKLHSPSAIGLNQYSWDMQHIYNYLKDSLSKYGDITGFIAGDFKNFDQNMVKRFQTAAYELIRVLSGVPEVAHKSFVSTQTDSPIQVKDCLIYLMTSHFSGCFFTTILNVLVHELYIRYIFELLCIQYSEEDLVFEDEVSLKILGDDHIYGVTEKIECWFNPVTIARALKKIGQTYTSDDKEAELTEGLRSFGDITFLGAHPIKIDGRWCGALKKGTLFESLHWTRNNNLTIHDECKQMMEYSSVWGAKFYDDYTIKVNKALIENGYPKIALDEQRSMALTVASRTAESGADFTSVLSSVCLQAQGPDIGITKLHERMTLDGEEFNNSRPVDQLVSKSTMVPKALMTLPTDSLIPRDIVQWTTDQQRGTFIASYKAPFDILKLGPQDNLQNTVFNMWEFVKCDIEIAIQINGQPMTQGMLVAYWQPLADYEAEFANMFTNSHVKITPNESATYSLRVPFEYPRNMISISEKEEYLGTIYIVVVSPLKSPEGNTVDLTVSFSFPQAQFRIPSDKIPASIAKSSFNKFYTLNHYTASGRVSSRRVWLNKNNYGKLLDGVELKGEGAGQSTVNNISYMNMGGEMPIQDAPISMGVAQDMKADQKADISAIPFHNPPLASGSIPVHQAFAGMSTTVGVEPVVDLQLHPAAMARQPKKVYNGLETNLAVIMGKECILTMLNITTGQLTDTQLYKFLLNSIMGVAEGDGIPVNIVALNQFFFWHATPILKFYAIKTRFHSTRLSGIVNYGIGDVRADSRSVAYNHIIDFSGENSKFEMVIDWNSQLEWLRTFEGYSVLDPFQDYAMGTFGLFLNNRLVAPNTVDQSMQLMVTLQFDNPRVAVPRAYSPFTVDDVERLSVPAVAMIITPVNGTGVKGFISPAITGSHDFVQFNAQQVSAPATSGYYDASGSGTLVERNAAGTILGSRVLAVTRVLLTISDVSFSFEAPVIFYQDYDRTQSEFVFESISLILNKKVLSDVKLKGQGPEPDSVDAETVHEDPSPKHTTEEVEPKVPMVPCRLEIGEKFEKRVVDILEIERRMRRLDPRMNASLNQFVSYTSVNGTDTSSALTIINFGVQPTSKWTRFFAAWAGSMIYRIFSKAPNCDVVFQPFANTSVSKGIPVVDPINGAQFQMLNDVVTTTSMTAGPMARERAYQTGNENGWITVSVPFQQQKNFCSTTPTQRISQLSNGTLAISYQTKRPDIFFKVGDDMGYYIYRAPKKTNFDMTAFKKGFAGFN